MQIKIDLKLFLLLLLFFWMGQIEIYALLILFAFLHELGHLLMGWIVGLRPKEVKITPFGVALVFQNTVQYYTPNQKMLKEIAVAIAGPLVNVGILLFCIIGVWQNELVMIVNLVLALFNLLPIYPLDGGRILKSIIYRYVSITETYRCVYRISNILLIIMTMLSSVVILYYHNIALVFAIAYLWWIVVRENRQYVMWQKIHKQEETILSR